jgi:hypothetical protein
MVDHGGNLKHVNGNAFHNARRDGGENQRSFTDGRTLTGLTGFTLLCDHPDKLFGFAGVCKLDQKGQPCPKAVCTGVQKKFMILPNVCILEGLRDTQFPIQKKATFLMAETRGLFIDPSMGLIPWLAQNWATCILRLPIAHLHLCHCQLGNCKGIGLWT